ncbi:hypothetical protein FRC02_004043 [Tulasnella sp. 418]|nr:hypothetical protein FRC02_004043 [Tulasnella sp. 418]
MNHLRNGLQNITALSSRLRWTRGLTTAPRPRVQYSSSRRSSDRVQCVHSTCSRAATDTPSHFGLNDSPFTRSALQAFQKHRVLYVDRSLVIINKPPGLTAQGTLSTDSAKRAETIQNAIDDLQEVLEQKEPLKTVHRLDKATTGALVLARNPKVIRTIHQQFDQRASQKVYLALVHDEKLRQTLQSVPGSYFPQSVDHELRHGTIDAPILVDYHGNVALAQLDQTNKLAEGVKRGITEWQWLSHSVCLFTFHGQRQSLNISAIGRI